MIIVLFIPRDRQASVEVFFSTNDVLSLFNCYRPQLAADTPLGSPPLGRQPPWADTPADTPQADTTAPWADTTRQKPPGQTPRLPRLTATAADGIHPTGMHSC